MLGTDDSDSASASNCARAYEYWSNGHYCEMLTRFAERWQNSNYCAWPMVFPANPGPDDPDVVAKRIVKVGNTYQRAYTGGYWLHMEFSGPKNVPDESDPLEHVYMRPDIDEIVFFNGGISINYNDEPMQAVMFNIVFAVATMKPTGDAQPAQAVIEYRLGSASGTLLGTQYYPAGTAPTLTSSLQSPVSPDEYLHHYVTTDGTKFYRPGAPAYDLVVPETATEEERKTVLLAVFYTPRAVYFVGRDEMFLLLPAYTGPTSASKLGVLNSPTDLGRQAYLTQINYNAAYSASNIKRLVRVDYGSESAFTKVSVFNIQPNTNYDVYITLVGAGGAGRSSPNPGGEYWAGYSEEVDPETESTYSNNYPLCTGGSGASGEVVEYHINNWRSVNGHRDFEIRLGRGGFKDGNSSPNGTDTVIRLYDSNHTTQPYEFRAKGGSGGTDVQSAYFHSAATTHYWITGPGAGGNQFAKGAQGMLYMEPDSRYWKSSGYNGDNCGRCEYDVCVPDPAHEGEYMFASAGDRCSYGYGSDIGCPGGGSAQFSVKLSYTRDTVVKTGSGTAGWPYEDAETYPTEIRSKGSNGMSTTIAEAPMSQILNIQNFDADPGVFGGGGGGAWKGHLLGRQATPDFYQGNGGKGGEGFAVVKFFDTSFEEIRYAN